MAGNHGLSTGTCAGSGGAPVMGLITGSFDIDDPNGTAHCSGNGGSPPGEAAIPAEVDG